MKNTAKRQKKQSNFLRIETERNNARHRRNIKRRRGGFRRRFLVAAVVCALFALAALFVLIRMWRSTVSAKGEHAQLRSDAIFENAEESPVISDGITDDTNTGISPNDADAWDGRGAVLTVDFERLLSENADTIAWLHVPAADVSYPVVHYATDNDYYMNRAFDGSDSVAGSIYLECTNAPDFTDRHSFLYGHNMRDGSMFGRLQERFRTDGVYEAGPYFYLYFPDGSVRRYLVFSYYETTKDSDTYYTFTDDDAYDWYAHYTRTMSEADAGFSGDAETADAHTVGTDAPDVDAVEQEIARLLAKRRPIVTLSTCAGATGTIKRFVVHGVLTDIFLF